MKEMKGNRIKIQLSELGSLHKVLWLLVMLKHRLSQVSRGEERRSVYQVSGGFKHTNELQYRGSNGNGREGRFE